MFGGVSKKEKWFNSLERRVSSCAMILENGVGQALIVKANYKSYWTFPGGIIDPGETPKEAAIRETLEEVGIAVNPSQVTFVAVVDRKSSRAQTYQFIFKAVLEKDALSHVALQASEIEASVLVTKAQVASGDRNYGQVIEHWAHDTTGYAEQLFVAEDNDLMVF